MLLNFENVPAGTRAETVLFGSRAEKKFTFYRLPEPLAQGPELRRDAGGHRYLLYMWDFYLFAWPYGTGTVSVYHGSIEEHGKEPLWSFNIDRPWGAEVLVHTAKTWAAANEAKYRKR